jgi:hypothetical protein
MTLRTRGSTSGWPHRGDRIGARLPLWFDSVEKVFFVVALDLSQSSFPERATVAPGNKRDKEHLMLDVVMLALGLGFFLVAVGYAHACKRL